MHVLILSIEGSLQLEETTLARVLDGMASALQLDDESCMEAGKKEVIFLRQELLQSFHNHLFEETGNPVL